MSFDVSKLLPSQVGADSKKLAILGGLLVVLVVVFFMTRGSGDTQAPAPAPKAPAARPDSVAIRNLPPEVSPGPRVATRVSVRGGALADRSIADFKPTLKLKEGTDVSKIDPSLHMELLAKVKEVSLSGGSRSLFEFAPPPAPPPPEVPKIYPFVGPRDVPPKPVETAAAKPQAPPPPPIPLKFYGFSGSARSSAARSAFFLDGEDIVIAKENDTIRNRYRIVRIGVNSAVVEDTANKNQQTLPLIEEVGS